MTNRSLTISWSSDHYISGSGVQLFFVLGQDTQGTTKPSPNNASFANLTRANNETFELVSQLHINVSAKYNTSTVICYNNAQDVNASITFSVGKNCMVVESLRLIILSLILPVPFM